MENIFQRTELLIGKDNVKKLNESKVAIFGIGGVGSYVLEGLARAGIGNFILVDADIVDETNINRQIIATKDTIGMDKVKVALSRVLSINPDAKIKTYKEFFSKDTKGILEKDIDYIVDSVDTVSAKIELVVRAKNLDIPIISCMGTGNKLDPLRLEIEDIYKTKVCPLAKVMRKELKQRGIESLKVLYSKEEPIKVENKGNARKATPGSISFVPSVAGLIIAGEVVKDIINKK